MIVDVVESVANAMNTVDGNSWEFTDSERHDLNVNPGSGVYLKPFFMLVHPIVQYINQEEYVDTGEFVLKIFLLQQSGLADVQSARNTILGKMYTAFNDMLAKFRAHADVVEIVGKPRTEEVQNAFWNNFDGLECDLVVKFKPSAYC